ncbi:MAG: acetyltransferase [Chitinophagaceae bacterium]|nr:acetyltransferase [Chitinophagaceae bacterium]
MENKITIRVATPADKQYSQIITDEMEASAKARGTGIAKRSPDYISQKMDEGKAVIALAEDGTDAKIFGLTTGLAVMKINSDLGYEPVTYSELTQDEAFWAGCRSCVNHDILMSKERKNCLCTAMLFDPKDHYEPAETKEHFSRKKKVYERLLRWKQSRFLNRLLKKETKANRRNKFPILNLFNF